MTGSLDPSTLRHWGLEILLLAAGVVGLVSLTHELLFTNHPSLLKMSVAGLAISGGLGTLARISAKLSA
jgi:hypothetical protein